MPGSAHDPAFPDGTLLVRLQLMHEHHTLAAYRSLDFKAFAPFRQSLLHGRQSQQPSISLLAVKWVTLDSQQQLSPNCSPS